MPVPERAERVLTWGLALALVASVIAVVVIAMNPPETTEPFTEFYVLGPGGEAADYPTELEPGGNGTVVVGISNHEHRAVTYRVVVTWNATATAERAVRVPDGATREVRWTLTAPDEPGRYRVRFELYVVGRPSAEPYRWLRLWVEVSPGS